jgi:hypothetical protein
VKKAEHVPAAVLTDALGRLAERRNEALATIAAGNRAKNFVQELKKTQKLEKEARAAAKKQARLDKLTAPKTAPKKKGRPPKADKTKEVAKVVKPTGRTPGKQDAKPRKQRDYAAEKSIRDARKLLQTHPELIEEDPEPTEEDVARCKLEEEQREQEVWRREQQLQEAKDDDERSTTSSSDVMGSDHKR